MKALLRIATFSIELAFWLHVRRPQMPRLLLRLLPLLVTKQLHLPKLRLKLMRLRLNLPLFLLVLRNNGQKIMVLEITNQKLRIGSSRSCRQKRRFSNCLLKFVTNSRCRAIWATFILI